MSVVLTHPTNSREIASYHDCESERLALAKRTSSAKVHVRGAAREGGGVYALQTPKGGVEEGGLKSL